MTRPRPAARLKTPPAHSLYVARTYAYLAAGNNGLVIVDVANPLTQHLHPQIRGRIDKQPDFVRLDVDRRARPVVFWVRQKLWRIVGPYDRHALRCAGTEDCQIEFHCVLFCLRRDLFPHSPASGAC